MTIAFRFALWVGVGATLYLSLTPVPPSIPGLASDPMKHAAGWAGLTLLSGMAYRKLPTLQLIVLLALGNLATEILQRLVPTGRDMDIFDWAWGMAGILVVAGPRTILHSTRPNAAKPCEATVDTQMTKIDKATVVDETTP